MKKSFLVLVALLIAGYIEAQLTISMENKTLQVSDLRFLVGDTIVKESGIKSHCKKYITFFNAKNTDLKLGDSNLKYEFLVFIADDGDI